MKVAASALLVGAATAAIAPPQQILRLPEQLKDSITSDAWTKPLHKFEEQLKSLTGEARRVWDEVALMFPESFDKAALFSTPKPHTRRADHEWDHVVKGADVQAVWVENAQGEKEREIDGKLENYNMRVKKVDPSVLGVDNVTQYSGYLDDEEEDKHLFYCEYLPGDQFRHPS
jgi:cathepsin A (carboxypeptidase C)